MVKEEGTFFFHNFASEEGRAHDWSSGCLEQLMLSRSSFSVTMVSCFEMVEEEYIEELKDKSKNQNTKNSTDYWKNGFKKWVNERNFQANLEEYESDVLYHSFVHSEMQ